MGSSPRVWGQGVETYEDLEWCGIIPTRVGTSVEQQMRTALLKDHPHACGDKINGLFDYRHPQGSSPRVWGQASMRSASLLTVGIIPTRVGTSGNVQNAKW